MSRLIDITGNRYNNLVVIKKAYSTEKGIPVWECLCDCGKTTLVRGSNLKSGAVKSCGCLVRQKGRNSTHGMSHTRLYHVWVGMRNRCYNKSFRSFKDYGLRGIKVCDEWKNSFESFMKWANENGYNDGLTIERINIDDDYCPSNCTWIPANQQQGNRRICYSIQYNGQTKNLADWCNELGLEYKRTHNRIFKLGWSFEKAISEPVNVKKRNKKCQNMHLTDFNL